MTIPDSWVEVRLGDVCSEDRRSIDGKADTAKKIPYLGLDSIESGTGKINLSESKYINAQGKSNCFLFDKRHVLYGKLRPYLNKVALPDFEGRCTTEAIPILPRRNMQRELLAYMLRSSTFVTWAMSTNTGSRMPRADMSKLLEIKIPLPPLAEQKRIVAKIEACFAQAEAIAADIDKAGVLLKKFREAVLAKAFAGELVAREPDTEWHEVRLGDVCAFEYGKPLKKENRRNGDYPVFGSNGIVGHHDGYLVKAPFIVVGRKGSAGAVNYSIKDGFPIDTTFYIQSSNKINLRYLYLNLMSLNLDSVNEQSAVPGLNRNDAYKLKIPLPPSCQQKRIVAKIEACFAQAEAIAADIDKAGVLLKKFREAVLAKAFAGELVPQDASEGTGHALLQKMTQEKQNGQE